MATYYQVRGDDGRVDREVTLGFPTYERLFTVARRAGATLLVRCGDFHGMDEFSTDEHEGLRTEIAAVRAASAGMPDVESFLQNLLELVSYAASRGKPIIADAD